ncbi:MAB_1171c family putative transporter [Streptomyces pathocidini]|uniref:MAB_1171c family putative transporter n=1 Tax=Streptomyces pathocidini TaxID=1650571 RepID=A0ABW7UP50_9ACTN|nr:MAB_1171c family putative transporter [Streptomyces pathocidini]
MAADPRELVGVEELLLFGKALEALSLACTWPVLLLRARAAVRCPQQRALWLAVATSAVAMTLSVPAVARLIARTAGAGQVADLAINLSGVLSAAAVLDFVTDATGRGRRARRWLWAAAGLVGAVLLALDLAAPPHGRHSALSPGSPQPSTAYWLIVVAAHLTANTACLRVCWRYAGRGEAARVLRSSLRLFGLGTACAGVFWLGCLLCVLIPSAWFVPAALLPTLMGLHGLLRAAALVVPVLPGLRRTVADARALLRLWPLWRALLDAAPQVALTPPRPRLLELLWPRASWHYLVYRKVIEIRDAVLVLRDYAPEADAEPPDPAAMARALAGARRAKLTGREPAPPPHPEWPLPAAADDFPAETAYWLAVARSYGGADSAA